MNDTKEKKKANKSNIVIRYNSMIFDERKKFLRLKEKCELSKLKMEQLEEEKEVLKQLK